MNLEDFRTAYRTMPREQRDKLDSQYLDWRSTLPWEMERSTPRFISSCVRASPGPQEHYDNILRAFLTHVATQRLLGESS